MSLAPSTRIGVYEVLEPLGAGGMGEVYRARDTRLHRDVAIKVLPEAVAADDERLARFEREARTLASLNHPNVAQVYGFEEGPFPGAPASRASDRALVMELVEGEDLAARIAAGPLPLADALAVARQVAEALDAAHSTGVIHRDLKPANIKVRADGTVKVLDFGLAKMIAPAKAGALTDDEGPGFSPASSPTMASPAMTSMGMLLGTAAYMSPEQARGRAVDKRADIWAFGCVLYEMLTGAPAFSGETVTDVLGSIVKSDPDWSKLPNDTPPNVTRLLRRCLQKDAARRLRDIGDVASELEAEPADPALSPRASLPRSAPARRWPVALAWVASLAAAAAAGVAFSNFGRPAPDTPLRKFHLAIQGDSGTLGEPVISPDGRQVAYVGRSRIFVQSLGEWKPRELAGTEAATRPFWSPAGDWIAYVRSERLLKVPVAGGPVVTVATLPAVQATLGAVSGTWRMDGTILLSQAAGGPVLRIPEGGGEARPFTIEPAGSFIDLHDLYELPGGAVVAGVHRQAGVDAIGVIKDGALRIVLEAAFIASPVYSPTGHLIYERAPNAGLWAVPFSLERLDVTGEPFLIGEGTTPSIARDGTLAYLGQQEAQARQLSWFSFDGRVGTRIAEPRQWIEGVSLAPDGKRVLASASDGLWAYDLETGARSRITTGPADTMPAFVDDHSIVFIRTDGTDTVLMLKRIGAGTEERVLARRARFPHATADGRRVVFNIAMQDRPGWEIAWIDLGQPTEIHRLGPGHAGARFPTVSPDGTKVSYISGEIGRDEIFLTQLPSGEGKWQLSTEGGNWALFSPRGDAVLYRAPDGAMMSVSIGGAPEVKIGPPQKLFDWGAGWLPFYDLARDGKSGIAYVPVGKSTSVTSLSIVQNWQQEFGKR